MWPARGNDNQIAGGGPEAVPEGVGAVVDMPHHSARVPQSMSNSCSSTVGLQDIDDVPVAEEGIDPRGGKPLPTDKI